ncbi:MAG: sigma-70 family RNA polymerase sigma factor [Pirellulales bacterium]|nr:sigma-70 family RNA polymerase sigma factor [Pirellulales bacterium]
MPDFTHESPSAGDGYTNSETLQAAQLYLEQRLERGEPIPEHGWQQFYAVYEPLIRRFAVRCRVPADELDDCVQEALQTVIVALRDFRYERSRGSFRGWLYSLVRSRATDLMRRRLRRTARLDLGAPTEQVAGPAAEPSAEIDRRWHSALVQQVVEQLRGEVSPRNFEVFYLRAIEERSVAEVAERTGSSPEKVRYRHHRMVRKFRDLFLLLTGEEYQPL